MVEKEHLMSGYTMKRKHIMKTLILHLCLAFPALLALFAAVIMFVMKIAELGAGPGLSWGLIAGVTAGGIAAVVLDVILVFRSGSKAVDTFLNGDD